jgi:hypothetical protein
MLSGELNVTMLEIMTTWDRIIRAATLAMRPSKTDEAGERVSG